MVTVRWPVGIADGTTVTYRIAHDGGATDVALDQRTGGAIWQPLGTFAMTPGQGHGVTLLGASPVPGGEIEIIVDDDDAAVIVTGSWYDWAAADAYNGEARFNRSGAGNDRARAEAEKRLAIAEALVAAVAR